ncbi:MAG: DUF192 domain-containing protein [Myxococcota bacterium]
MRDSVLGAVAMAVVASVSLSCSHNSETGEGQSGKERNAGDKASAAAATDSPPLVIFEPEGKPRAAVLVEVARTDAKIQRGLMFRRELGENDGMLFLMNEERVHSFWMQNTYISLDMIFIGKDKVVVGVVENTVPRSTASRSVGKPSFYVVEVNAGWSAKNHVGPGTRVRFKNIRE